ncbi:MAG: translocation/assembly module TamB domain-containing protein [Myxococcales bacterium]
MTEHTPEPVYEPVRPPPRELKPGWRKAGRVLWIGFFSLLGFVVLAVVAALVWLHTGTGREELGRYVTHEARNAIQGDLRVRQIRVGGFLHVCVDGVELRDPDGHKVLAAERACVKLKPLSLKAHRVVLTEAQLEKPWVEIAKVPGTNETTLQRAIKPKHPSAPGGPLQWVIDVQSLQLTGGTVTMRPELGEPATFALEDLTISDAHALYAADQAAAGLKLSAQIAAPGRIPAAVDLDASVEGALATGKVALRTLRVKLGESGLAANGSWDIARNAGAVAIRELKVLPEDLEKLLPKKPLASAVSGEADLKSDGTTAQVALRLDGGGGHIDGKATVTLDKKPTWDLQLTVDHVDPGALSPKAPKGQVDARASLHGKGRPEFDEHGVRGDFGGALHVGPANLDRIGPVVADLDAHLQGRYAIVKAFSATALGLTVKAHGAAAYDEVSIDLDVRAPDLAHVGKAVGALTRKKSLPLAGSTHLTARVTGSPQRPDAQVHLRAPRLRWNPTVAAEGLAVDGVLHGPLTEPDGTLEVVAQRLSAGKIDLGAPRIAMDLAWPVMHLGIDAGVKDGSLQLAGDATIDDDKDGLVLSNFTVAYPGNQLKLAHSSNVHFRDEIIVEPIDLVGDHGSLRFQAQVQPPPGRIDAALVVTRFELDHLPQFALPKDLALHGIVDANAVVQGPRDAPDVDLRADVHQAGAKPIGDLSIDAHTHAHVHTGRLKTDGWVASPGVLRFDWNGDLPLEKLQQTPGSAPLQLEAQLGQVDLAKLADTAKLSKLQQQRIRGVVDARLVASGTLAAPRATLSIDAKDVGNDRFQHVDARTGMLLEKGKASLDGTIALGGKPAVAFTAQAPFDLQKAVKDKAYLRGAVDRALTAEVAITQLQLERLASSGLLPQGSAGAVSLSVRLGGTPARPQLHLYSSGDNVTVGRLHGLGFQGQLDIVDQVKLTAGAQSQGDVVARLDAGASLSGAELLELMARRNEPDAIAPLLDRTVSMTLEIPGLPIARASQLAGKTAVAEGKLTGRVALTGTPARPHLVGQLALRDLAARDKHLGQADLYVEAESSGALVHVGIDPPGGGNFLGHVKLDADLGGRTLLRDGFTSVLDGQLSGQVQAKALDLAFLSGLFPRLRRTGGTLEADVKMAGLLGKPVANGDAHLHRGLFDVIGQGVYEDVGLDATFSPKEVVIDRITGTTGTGTFAAILVAARKPAADGETEPIEFTGEVHLGDDESVRDRKTSQGTPLHAGPVPMRQAGEQRADVSGELDIFGDYTENLLTVNAKIPDARVVIKALPDKKLPKLKENPDVLLVHPGEKPHPPGREPEDVEAEAEQIRTATFRMHAHLDLVHLYVKASDFEFPVESNMNFDYDARHPDTPTADGTVHVPQGSFNALGRRFTVGDAKITETGGAIEDPELEIKALFENPQANVTITITGTAKEPDLNMSSTPPMDQDAIAFFLATGRIQGRATQTGGGVDLSGAATSVLGSLLFGQVRKELADVLPVDVLTIETGSQGVSEASIGKYIGDRVFIGYRQRLVPAQNENTEEGRIEYEISRAVSAEATVGDRNSDISVLYTKDF